MTPETTNAASKTRPPGPSKTPASKTPPRVTSKARPPRPSRRPAVQTDLEGDLLHHYYERKAAWALEKEQLQTDNARISKALAKAEAQLDTYRAKEAGWALKLGEERGALAQARSQLEAKEAAEERRRAESRARWTTQG